MTQLGKVVRLHRASRSTQTDTFGFIWLSHHGEIRFTSDRVAGDVSSIQVGTWVLFETVREHGRDVAANVRAISDAQGTDDLSAISRTLSKCSATEWPSLFNEVVQLLDPRAAADLAVERLQRFREDYAADVVEQFPDELLAFPHIRRFLTPENHIARCVALLRRTPPSDHSPLLREIVEILGRPATAADAHLLRMIPEDIVFTHPRFLPFIQHVPHLHAELIIKRIAHVAPVRVHGLT